MSLPGIHFWFRMKGTSIQTSRLIIFYDMRLGQNSRPLHLRNAVRILRFWTVFTVLRHLPSYICVWPNKIGLSKFPSQFLAPNFPMGHGGPWSISGGGSEGGEVPPEDAGARVEPGEATRGEPGPSRLGIWVYHPLIEGLAGK